MGIVGRPNVGKSTLLNLFIEQKLSIVTRKPQTTRWNLQGIKSDSNTQIIFVDTPGLQKHPKHALNRYMNREVRNSLIQADIVLFVIEAMKWNEHDNNVFQLIKKIPDLEIIVVLNKADRITHKNNLLAFIELISNKTGINNIVPISAKKEQGITGLEALIISKLPIADAVFPTDQITDRNERFFAAEFIREKLITRLGDEIPYRLAITIDEFNTKDDIIYIAACIWVDKKGQKAIVIGKDGKVLKSAGQAARKELESLFDKKVYLKTWVKVKAKWIESEQALKQLGYVI